MNNEELPTEEEQFQSYSEVLKKMGEKPVVIRTLDIGGDKKLPYLPIDEEMNPFLGYRAIRLCLDRRDVFRTQLRALLRASAFGNLKIMFPMISCLEELRQAKQALKEAEEELLLENQTIGKYEVGIMIEIPSAAIMSDILAKEVDFFSIGTNDLIQYTIAVDRMNEKVSYLYNPYNISLLRLISMVIENAHKHNKWVGMCGEVAGDPLIMPLLLGFGLDEFSMAASTVLKARKLLLSLTQEECKNLAKEVLLMSESIQIQEHLKNFIKSK
jgi:phosphotransferase system enzyme I (PtsI)